MNVKLHSSVRGSGPDVVLLHGLFGSGNNLGALARSLQQRYRVHSLDLPNHGRSDWLPRASIGVMAAVVVSWLQEQGLEKASLVGHSLGGKIAMEIALSRPELVRSLVVADIAPVAYPPRHDAVFEALSAVAGTACRSRQQAAARMADFLDEPGVIQFLLSSLQRADDGSYQWRFNLDGIRADYPALCEAPPTEDTYPGPVLFIRGGQSEYIVEAHRRVIRALFPRAGLKVMLTCGHWLHAEQPDVFNRLVGRFLDAPSA